MLFSFILGYCLLFSSVAATETNRTYEFQSNFDYIYHYATDIHIDHKIWSGSEENQIKHKHDAAFHLYAQLNITSVWRNDKGNEHLLKIELKHPRFLNRTNSHSMIDCLALNTLTRYPSMFIWHDGIVTSAYFHENDDVAAINFKKGIMSLFQYKQDNTSEIDTLGKCQTEYRVHEKQFIKDKFHCSNVQYKDEYSHVKQALNYSLEHQSTCVYTFENSSLQSASCSDLAFPRLNIPQIAGFRIMSRLNIHLSEKVANSKHEIYTNSNAALKSVLSLTPDQYHTLETEKQNHPCDDYCERFDEFIHDHANQLSRNLIGNKTASDVFLHLISLSRRQTESVLSKSLDKASNSIKYTLIEAFIAAQTPASINVVVQFVDNALKTKSKTEVVELFLLTTAFAPRPIDLLYEKIEERLSKFTSIDSQFEQNVYLSLGAIVHRLYDLNKNSPSIEKFSNLLEKTRKKSLVYLSLYNAKLEQYQSILIDEIRRCNNTNLCWLALNALTQYNVRNLSTEVIGILRSIYHEQAGRPKTNLQIRQICGQILLRTDISIGDLVNLILSAFDKSNHQLGTYVWRLISSTAEHDELLFRKIRFVFDQGLVDVTYNNLAFQGHSDFYRRTFARTFGFGVYYTISQLMSRLGALRESDFDLHVQQYKTNEKFSLLSIGVSASGLEAYVSNDGKSNETPDENLQAELRISLLNMQLRPVVLFNGVTGLMSAVWSAPSDLTSAFKTNVMIHDVSRYIRLHNGLIVHYEAQSAASLDLSGMASVSLWNKNSHSVIEISSGLSVSSHIDILNDFIVMGINATYGTNVVVDYTTDIDYSDTPIQVCMQMSMKPAEWHERVENFYALKKSKAVRWYATRKRHYLGEDFSFTQKNDAMCRQMHLNN